VVAMVVREMVEADAKKVSDFRAKGNGWGDYQEEGGRVEMLQRREKRRLNPHWTEGRRES